MKYILLCLVSVFMASCYNTERNCADFKTGEFEFTYTLNGKEIKSTFIRNDSMEYDFLEGRVDTNSIRWINDCEFVVKKLNPKNIQESKAIHMKILTTSKKTYKFEYSIVGDQKNKQQGIATKIR